MWLKLKAHLPVHLTAVCRVALFEAGAARILLNMARLFERYWMQADLPLQGKAMTCYLYLEQKSDGNPSC